MYSKGAAGRGGVMSIGLSRWRVGALVAVIACVLPSLAQSQEVTRRAVNIYSDGTRLAGDIWFPAGLGESEKAPTILLAHGWGGLKSHLNGSYAPAFAAAGYIVLAFDYRGWGESDSRLVIVGDQPEPDANGHARINVQVIREVVDPLDQLEDIRSALNFLEGEPQVDMERLGIWGSSFGGGLVVMTAINDPRVKVVVSQVGAMNGRSSAEVRAGGLDVVHEKEIQRARGEAPPVPQGEDVVEGLDGTPYFSQFARYAPVDEVDRLNVPTLLIDAANENLFDITQHSGLVYERIKDRIPSRYHIEPGIEHYGIYGERFPQSVELALEWHDQYLKPMR